MPASIAWSNPPLHFATQQKETMVYTSRTGEKYHRDNCRYLSRSKLLKNDCLFLSGTGNEQTIVTLVSNPNCPACATAHEELNWVWARNDVSVQVVFAITGGEDSVVQHLMALSTGEDKKVAINALKDWYGRKQKTVQAWINKYPAKIESAGRTILNIQTEWCHAVGIEETPTIMVNGRKIPENYSSSDLKYLI